VICRGQDIGARYVINVSILPNRSGFGRIALAALEWFPQPFTPLERR
jgi:hypothetical protein